LSIGGWLVLPGAGATPIGKGAQLRPQSSAEPGAHAQEHHEAGRRNLRAGRWFERAAREFQQAVDKEPNNYAHHLGLGCALASRAASIAYAAQFTEELAKERRDYPKELAAWERAQKDPASDGYGDPRPEPPRIRAFPTKDDNRPFTLTPKQARARYKELADQANSAWEKAAALAKTDAERAETEYVRGWGRLILKQYDLGEEPSDKPNEDDEESEDEESEEPDPAPDAEMLKPFEAAVALAPDNPFTGRDSATF
jgi:hypothetical protein